MSRACVRSRLSGVTDASPSRTALQSDPGRSVGALLGAADPVVRAAPQILAHVDLIAVDPTAEEGHPIAANGPGGQLTLSSDASGSASRPARMISAASARCKRRRVREVLRAPPLQRHGERRHAAQRALDRARHRPRIEDVRPEVEAVVDARHDQRRPPRHEVQQREVDAVDRRPVDREDASVRSRRPAAGDRARSNATLRSARDRAPPR